MKNCICSYLSIHSWNFEIAMVNNRNLKINLKINKYIKDETPRLDFILGSQGNVGISIFTVLAECSHCLNLGNEMKYIPFR